MISKYFDKFIKRTFILYIFLVLSTFGYSLLLSIFSKLGYVNLNSIKGIINVTPYIKFIIYAVLIITFFTIMKTEIKLDFQNYKKYDGKIPQLLYCTFVLIVVSLLSYIILGYFIGLLKNNNNPNINLNSINSVINQNFYKSALISLFLMPFITEIVFRKTLINTIISDLKLSSFTALIISSLAYGLFSIGFGTNLLNSLIIAIPFILQGFVLGYFYIKYKYNAFTTIAIQTFTNLIIIIIYYNSL